MKRIPNREGFYLFVGGIGLSIVSVIIACPLCGMILGAVAIFMAVIFSEKEKP